MRARDEGLLLRLGGPAPLDLDAIGPQVHGCVVAFETHLFLAPTGGGLDAHHANIAAEDRSNEDGVITASGFLGAYAVYIAPGWDTDGKGGRFDFDPAAALTEPMGADAEWCFEDIVCLCVLRLLEDAVGGVAKRVAATGNQQTAFGFAAAHAADNGLAEGGAGIDDLVAVDVAVLKRKIGFGGRRA